MRRMNDSAQLLLVAGFAIGVGIVVLTIMLNNVIYASNIASESSIDASRYEMSNAVRISTEACEDAYRYAMANGTFNDTAFDEYIDVYTEKASENYGMAGYTFNIRDTNASEARFTQNGLPDGDDEWTPVRNINITKSFALSFPDAAKLGNGSERLTIRAISNSGSLLWYMELCNSSGKVNVTVGDHLSAIDSYLSVSGEINVTGDLIDGSARSLYFADRTAGHNISIEITGGSNAVGTYSISGNLSSGQPFTQARHMVVNPMIIVSGADMSINRTLPVSLPGGNA